MKKAKRKIEANKLVQMSKIRLKKSLHRDLAEAAKKTGKPLSVEIADRLATSFNEPHPTISVEVLRDYAVASAKEATRSIYRLVSENLELQVKDAVKSAMQEQLGHIIGDRITQSVTKYFAVKNGA